MGEFVLFFNAVLAVYCGLEAIAEANKGESITLSALLSAINFAFVIINI